MKTKKIYRQPETTVSRVELESPICGGSAVIENPNNETGRIEGQGVNTGFDAGSESTGLDNGWTFTPNE